MNHSRSTTAQTIVLVAALVLLVVAVGLSIAGLLSPSWQIVDIREFRAEHHHGLWQDCARAHRHLVSHFDAQRADNTALSCTYKFDESAEQVIDENLMDVDQSSAALEAEHHQFFGWHKAVLICIFLSLIMSVLALCLGLCAPCHSACAVVFTLLIFISLFFSTVADGVFFFAAHRVDSRFVQGLVGTYEQHIGSAFYMYGSGTVLLLFSFIVAVVATYQLLQIAESRSEMPIRELAPLYNTRMKDTQI